MSNMFSEFYLYSYVINNNIEVENISNNFIFSYLSVNYLHDIVHISYCIKYY